MSISATRSTTLLSRRRCSIFFGSQTTPPPVLTMTSAAGSVAITSRSILRNRSSPSSWKISGIERPVLVSIRSSVSIKGTFSPEDTSSSNFGLPGPAETGQYDPFHFLIPASISQNSGNDLFTHSALEMVIPPIPRPSTAKLIAVRWSFSGSMSAPWRGDGLMVIRSSSTATSPPSARKRSAVLVIRSLSLNFK